MNKNLLKAAGNQTRKKLKPMLSVFIGEEEMHDGYCDIHINEKNKDEAKTSDEKTFGINQWVYCRQHLRPHLTGWCTVPVSEKIGLGISNTSNSEKEAFKKCKDWGFKIYGQ